MQRPSGETKSTVSSIAMCVCVCVVRARTYTVEALTVHEALALHHPVVNKLLRENRLIVRDGGS